MTDEQKTRVKQLAEELADMRARWVVVMAGVRTPPRAVNQLCADIDASRKALATYLDSLP